MVLNFDEYAHIETADDCGKEAVAVRFAVVRNEKEIYALGSSSVCS